MKTLQRQKGLTLIELMASLVVLGIVAVIAGEKVMEFFEQRAEEQIISDVARLQAGAVRYRGTNPNFTGVSCPNLLTDKYVQVPWSSCNGVNPKNGNYTVAANSSNANDLDIGVTNLSTSLCNRLSRTMTPRVIRAACSGGTLTVTVDG